MSGWTGGGCPGIGGPPLPRPVPKRPGSKPGTPGGPAKRRRASARRRRVVTSHRTSTRTVWIVARARRHTRRQLRWMAGCAAAAWEECWVVGPNEHAATTTWRHHRAKRRYERHASREPVLVAYAAEVARRALRLPAAARGNTCSVLHAGAARHQANTQRRARTDHLRRIRLRTLARARVRGALDPQPRRGAQPPASAWAAARRGRARADPPGWSTPRRSCCRACRSCTRRRCCAGRRRQGALTRRRERRRRRHAPQLQVRCCCCRRGPRGVHEQLAAGRQRLEHDGAAARTFLPVPERVLVRRRVPAVGARLAQRRVSAGLRLRLGARSHEHKAFSQQRRVQSKRERIGALPIHRARGAHDGQHRRRGGHSGRRRACSVHGPREGGARLAGWRNAHANAPDPVSAA